MSSNGVLFSQYGTSQNNALKCVYFLGDDDPLGSGICYRYYIKSGKAIIYKKIF